MASEPPADMTTCEQMQVAHEMWAHGAQASIDAGVIARHATTCDLCGSYVAQSRKIDTMTALTAPTLDFTQVRDRIVDEVPKARRNTYLVIAIYAAAVIYGVVTASVSMVVIMGILGLHQYRKTQDRVSDLVGAKALGREDQLALWRADVAAQLREANFWLLWTPALFAAYGAGYAYLRDPSLLIVGSLLVPAVVQMVRRRAKLRAEIASWH